MKRVILHVDMDAFFAAVEQRDHPELRGRPVVVGAPPDRRGVVAAASYEARRFGIRSAMPSREAGRRCPHAAFVRPDMKRYAAVSKQVFAILERFSPFVEPVSIDEAFLDVTGSQALFGDGRRIAERIREAIRAETGLTASVGIASNKFLAKVASDLNKPDGLTLVPSEPDAIRRFLAPLPVSRLWGAGRVTARALEALGVTTVGDLQRADPSAMRQALGGAAAEHLCRLAQGIDDRDVETETDEKSLSREHTFLEDCADRDRVERVLEELVEDVGRRVREHGVYASVARLKLRWRDFRTITRQAPLDPPCCDDFRLLQAARRLFGRERMVQPVRLIGFGASGFRDRPPAQLGLFEAGRAGGDRRETLSRTVDRIRSRYGSDSIGRARRNGE